MMTRVDRAPFGCLQILKVQCDDVLFHLCVDAQRAIMPGLLNAHTPTHVLAKGHYRKQSGKLGKITIAAVQIPQ